MTISISVGRTSYGDNLAQAVASDAVANKNAKMVVKGTADEIKAKLHDLEQQYTHISTVTVTNGGHLSLHAVASAGDTSAVQDNKDVILKLTGAVVDVLDSGSNIGAAISDLTGVKSKLNMVAIDATADHVVLDATQVANNKAAILKLNTAALEVVDEGANIGNKFASLDAVYSKIAAISESGSTNITIKYSDYRAAKHGAGIDKFFLDGMTGTDGVAIQDFFGSANELATLNNDNSVKTISIKDGIDNLTKNSALIRESAKITDVTVNDKFKNIFTAAAQTLIKNLDTKVTATIISMNASEITSGATGTIAIIDGTNTDPNGLNNTNVANNATTTLNIKDAAGSISKYSTALVGLLTTAGTMTHALFDTNITVAGASAQNKAKLSMNYADYLALHGVIDSTMNNYALKDVLSTDATHIEAGASDVISYAVKDDAGVLSTTTNGGLSTRLKDIAAFERVTKISTTGAYTDLAGFNNAFNALQSSQVKKIGTFDVTDTAANLLAAGVLTVLGNDSKVQSITAQTASVANIRQLETSDAARKMKSIELDSADLGLVAYVNGLKRLDPKVTIV